MRKDYNQIPANAFVFDACELKFGDNGENAKTAPIRLKARSGKPIDHWYWGKVVHDFAGMKVKNRIPVDYVHNDFEIVGYINHFNIEDGDLMLSGALVPFKDSDRATEIVYKMKNGVPYESSINFAGEGIKVQEIGEGEIAEVNGYQFEGPGVIIREWPLRGVAICPYGADSNTEASAFGAGNKSYAAELVKPEAGKEETEMSEKDKEVKQPVAELAEVEKIEVENEAVEQETVETEVEAEKAVEAPEEVEQMSVEEFKKCKDEFGAEIAAEVFASGGNYSDALKLAYESTKKEVAELKEKFSNLSEAGGEEPVKVVSKTEKKSLFRAK